MRTFVHVITDRDGLHARSCVVLANEAAKWNSDIAISCNGSQADAKSVSSMLGLHAEKGDDLIIACEGEDEQAASVALEALMRMSI